MPEAAGAVLDVAHITVRFGGIRALSDVTLRVAPGEVCGLIGPNGAGKTTLFDVISGVRRPEEGRVVLDGVDVSGRGPVERYGLGAHRTFQRVQTFGWLTVEENILVALESGAERRMLGDLVRLPWRATRRSTERQTLVDEVVERCGLGRVRHAYAGSLPIGIGRMVEFARATVRAPRLLLLDEPASGLGEPEMGRLGEQIRQVRAASGCAVVLVEHNAGFVMEHCDRVVVLHLGSVLAEGTPEQIQAHPAVREAYLGDPHPMEA